jgi:protein SCO1/2
MSSSKHAGASALSLILSGTLSCAPVTAPPLGAGESSTESTSSLFQKPWRWTDEHGELVTFSKWKGSPLVLSMFYRSCTTRCPLTVAKLQRIEAAFARQNRSAHFVLVTLDPHNDQPWDLFAFKTAERLSEQSWHILQGGDADTRSLEHFLELHASAVDEGHIDHEVRIAVFDAEGRRVKSFRGWGFDDEEAVIPQ